MSGKKGPAIGTAYHPQTDTGFNGTGFNGTGSAARAARPPSRLRWRGCRDGAGQA